MLRRTPEVITGACHTPARSTHGTRQGGSNSTLCRKSVLLRPLGARAVGLSGQGGGGTTEVKRRDTGTRVPVCPRGFQPAPRSAPPTAFSAFLPDCRPRRPAASGRLMPRPKLQPCCCVPLQRGDGPGPDRLGVEAEDATHAPRGHGNCRAHAAGLSGGQEGRTGSGMEGSGSCGLGEPVALVFIVVGGGPGLMWSNFMWVPREG